MLDRITDCGACSLDFLSPPDPIAMNRIIELVLEAHRRSLWQVLGVYAVGSWIAYDVIFSLTEGLGLPDWEPSFALGKGH